ncbi:MAG: hypothetical protein AB1414_02340 [bacterium]
MGTMTISEDINTYYKKMKLEIDKYNSLLLMVAYDSEKNSIVYLENNLVFYRNHIQNCVFGKMHYNIIGDTELITHILNYISIVKSYLNRKKRSIEHNFKFHYKDEILKIFEKYWKSKRGQTILDRLILIRDQFEHEQLFGFAINHSFDGVIARERIMIDDVDISVLFYDAYIELKNLNSEITNYINSEIRKINLNHCLHFMYAFHRKFKSKPFTNRVMIRESQEDILFYDQLILDINKSK